MNRKSIWTGTLLLALLAGAFAVPGVQLANGMTERLTNGSFESGFRSTPAGFVGNGWHWFHNGGEATYGFYDDTWAPVVYDGRHSQLIEINTFCRGGSDPDRYAGIYQTVAVVPGETYELSLHGMLRALEDDPDRAGYNYRVEYGIDYDGGTDWTAVSNWVEIPWNTVYPRLSPGAMESYATSLTAASSRLTLYLRVWKKWGTARKELDVNLDAISLRGAVPPDTQKPKVRFKAPEYPVVGRTYTIHVKSRNGVGITKLKLFDNGQLVGQVSYDVGMLELNHDFLWTPGQRGWHVLKAVAVDAAGKRARHRVSVRVRREQQLIKNGGFEQGFTMGPQGMVGNGWGRFNNGGQANYGYYDETWAPVIWGGQHSQLIEINTIGYGGGSDADRYSGIYQTVKGLKPGATYELTVHGMLRARMPDEDICCYNYRVEWGYEPSGGTDWRTVSNWVEIPWDTVYPRLEPGSMDTYTASFVAPSSTVTLFIRAWKKWGTAERELDVNLDAISLKGLK